MAKIENVSAPSWSNYTKILLDDSLFVHLETRKLFLCYRCILMLNLVIFNAYLIKIRTRKAAEYSIWEIERQAPCSVDNL